MKEYSYKFKTRIERLGDIGPVFCRPENVTEWLRGKAWEAEEDWKEHCVAVFTNKANRVIGFETISVGTQDKCILDPKPICRTAIDILADGIIIIHNHPSGNPMPSKADIERVHEIKTALNCLQIKFLDFIIMGEKQAYSYATESKFKLSCQK